jgi:hypothetical protein
MKKIIFIFIMIFLVSVLYSKTVYSGSVKEISYGVVPWLKVIVKSGNTTAIVRVTKELTGFVQPGDMITIIYDKAFYISINGRRFLIYTFKVLA